MCKCDDTDLGRPLTHIRTNRLHYSYHFNLQRNRYISACVLIFEYRVVGHLSVVYRATINCRPDINSFRTAIHAKRSDNTHE